MKFVICCFLAVCAFKAVFAETLNQKIKSAHDNYAKQIHKIMDPIVKDYQGEVTGAKRSGKYDTCRDRCREDAITAIQNNGKGRIVKLDKCRDKAIKDKNTKYATDCFDTSVKNFDNEVKGASTNADICISLCG